MHPMNYAYSPFIVRNSEVLRNRNESVRNACEGKGVPVPFTGGKSWRKPLNGAGVSANSRIVSRYADEGEKGKDVRRTVRRMEERMWRMDWVDEGYDIEDASTVAQWFYDMSDDTDSDMIPSVYTVGETVVEWPNDYYDEYGYAYDPYDYYGDYDYVDFNPYDFEGYAEYCFHCGGECEL